jgi:hypothetical protein
MSTELIARLKAELKEISERVAVVQREEKEKTQQLAAAIAESIGLKIGSVISTERKEGFGNDAKVKKRRYIVTSFTYRGYADPPLEISGRTLKKDGTQGERFNIWQDFKIEKGV